MDLKLGHETFNRLNPCERFKEWYKNNITVTDLKLILLKVNDKSPEWAAWLMVNMLCVEECRSLALYIVEKIRHCAKGDRGLVNAVYKLSKEVIEEKANKSELSIKAHKLEKLSEDFKGDQYTESIIIATEWLALIATDNSVREAQSCTSFLLRRAYMSVMNDENTKTLQRKAIFKTLKMLRSN